MLKLHDGENVLNSCDGSFTENLFYIPVGNLKKLIIPENDIHVTKI